MGNYTYYQELGFFGLSISQDLEINGRQYDWGQPCINSESRNKAS